ncbi:MAG: DUF2330 domain-containing protein [Myxococcota bacterium]
MKLLIGSGLVFVGVAAISEPAWACGGGGVASSSGVVMDAQRIIMSRRANGTTDVVAQVGVPSTTADYGLLIPVPSEPTIDAQPVSATELASLDTLTVPRINTESSGSDAPGCGCGAASKAGDDTRGGSNRGVTTNPPVTIGPVEAVSLTGDSAEAINTWLSENGFALTQADVQTLTAYVGDGNYFIAIRRSDSAVTGGPTSIGIHYTLAGDHRKLSLGFARIGAAETVAFTLFLAAPQAIGPSAPFKALTLGDLESSLLRNSGYPAAVQAAVTSHDSKAFVLEGTTSQTDLVHTVPSIARLIDDGAVITRATTVIQRTALSDDVVFATPYSGNIPNYVYASVLTQHPRYASFGPLGVLFAAGALRRRWRGR